MKSWQILLLFHVCWFTLIYLLLRIDKKSERILERLRELEKKVGPGKGF